MPPYTSVESLGFEDHPFAVQRWDAHCELCGATDSFLDEVITDDSGTRMHVCSDSDYCQSRQPVVTAARPGAVQNEAFRSDAVRSDAVQREVLPT